MSASLSRFMSSFFASWRSSRYSRLATFTIFISAALVLSSSEIANKATHPHLRDGRNGDSNIAKIDGGETFEFWISKLPSILEVDARFMDLFKLFMMRYRRLYLFSSEMVTRARVFVNNTVVAEHLEEQNRFARFGITAYSDLEPEEFLQAAGVTVLRDVSAVLQSNSTKSGAANTRSYKQNTSTLLDIASYRPTNVSTTVRLQGAWASSIAHAVTASVETAIIVKQQKLTQLSVQELMDCGSPQSISDALAYVSQNGLVEEFEHPYLTRPANCSETPTNVPRFGRHVKYAKVGASEGDLMRAVQSTGSVVALLPVCSDLWQHYQGGIISSECPVSSAQGVMAVQITGWGIENGYRFWNIRTSLGHHFGERGSMRLLLGRGLWSIANEAYSVEL